MGETFTMATLGLKEMRKFLWKGREKVLPYWLSQFSKTKPKVAIAKFIWKMQKKVCYYEKWIGRHASFPPRRSVKQISSFLNIVRSFELFL